MIQHHYEKMTIPIRSSYGVYLGVRKCPSWLETDRTLGRFARIKEEQRREYGKFVEEEVVENPLQGMQFGVVLGSRDYVERFQTKLKVKEDDPEVSQLAKAKPRVDLAKICTVGKRAYAVDDAHLRSKGRKVNEGRDVAIDLARRSGSIWILDFGFWIFQIRNLQSKLGVGSLP
jgi:hypothetical protein